MEVPDHLTCLLRNLYAGQEATVRTRHGTIDWFQIVKGIHLSVYCHPAYLTYMLSALYASEIIVLRIILFLSSHLSLQQPTKVGIVTCLL